MKLIAALPNKIRLSYSLKLDCPCKPTLTNRMWQKRCCACSRTKASVGLHLPLSPSWNPSYKEVGIKDCGEKPTVPAEPSPKPACQLTTNTGVSSGETSRAAIRPIHRIMRNDKHLYFCFFNLVVACGIYFPDQGSELGPCIGNRKS